MPNIPFTDISQFYEGQIIWCDPQNPEMAGTKGSRRPVRPCLIIRVNRLDHTIDVAPFSEDIENNDPRWKQTNFGEHPVCKWSARQGHGDKVWVAAPQTVAIEYDTTRTMFQDKDPKRRVWSLLPMSENNKRNWHFLHQEYLTNMVHITAAMNESRGSYQTTTIPLDQDFDRSWTTSDTLNQTRSPHRSSWPARQTIARIPDNIGPARDLQNPAKPNPIAAPAASAIPEHKARPMEKSEIVSQASSSRLFPRQLKPTDDIWGNGFLPSVYSTPYMRGESSTTQNSSPGKPISSSPPSAAITAPIGFGEGENNSGWVKHPTREEYWHPSKGYYPPSDSDVLVRSFGVPPQYSNPFHPNNHRAKPKQILDGSTAPARGPVNELIDSVPGCICSSCFAETERKSPYSWQYGPSTTALQVDPEHSKYRWRCRRFETSISKSPNSKPDDSAPVSPRTRFIRA
ncbi:hypothetical protein R3P38DRAFT_2773848 [Favolaschia claudopus]|uniref:Uncharacterized protein n=1 Tax=Favolaschia claudopus TaxID=2862362 RepID=A0AAW0C748_9AGAR